MKQQLSLFNTDVIPAGPPRPKRRRKPQPITIDSLCRGFILQWGKDQALEPETMTQLAEKLRLAKPCRRQTHLEKSVPDFLQTELGNLRRSREIDAIPEQGDMVTIDGEDWKIVAAGRKHWIIVRGARGRKRFSYTPATGELSPSPR